MNNQKKLVQLFRNFVQKVFLPNLKKTDPQYFQWTKFNKLITNETINYQTTYQYVQSITSSTNTTSPHSFEKKDIPLFRKKKEENQQPAQEEGFNPSKTFGGERARMMIMKGQYDDFGQQRRDAGNSVGNQQTEQYKKNITVSAQTMIPGLEKLYKLFLENQQRIENNFSNGSLSPSRKR